MGKMGYTYQELLREHKDAWIPSLPLDLLPFCLKTFKITQQLLQTLNEQLRTRVGSSGGEWGLAWGGYVV